MIFYTGIYTTHINTGTLTEILTLTSFKSEGELKR